MFRGENEMTDEQVKNRFEIENICMIMDSISKLQESRRHGKFFIDTADKLDETTKLACEQMIKLMEAKLLIK